MITFGLYHGLVFLPVLLSLVGPDAYQHLSDEEEGEEGAKEMEELPIKRSQISQQEAEQRKQLFTDDIAEASKA